MSRATVCFELALVSAGIITLPACMPNGKGFDNEMSMVECTRLALPLDSITTQETSYMQLVDDSTLAFFNKPTYDICVYDLRDKVLRNRISLRREGPDAVNGIDAFFLSGQDSIWLYASWGNVIYLLDGNSSLREKRSIDDDVMAKDGGTRHSVSPFPTTTTPYTVVDGRHILQGMDGIVLQGKMPGATVIYDWNSGKVETANGYPSIYGEGNEIQNNWDTFGYRETYYTLNAKNDIVTSFPASDSIYVYSPNSGKSERHYAGYSETVDIKPGVPSDPDSKTRKFISQHQYSGVLYDRFNDLYYRIIRLPGNADAQDVRKEISSKPVVVIILDGEFNKVGEYRLPEDMYYTANAFVTPDGLHVNTVSDDDDLMTFRVFKPQSSR
ncbi:MAG: DUF4221 domain-containing protein [Muribaculaceae bacterium]|nr:DUF4221 domain-containing protein [Muribaculaceae bacterium]